MQIMKLINKGNLFLKRIQYNSRFDLSFARSNFKLFSMHILKEIGCEFMILITQCTFQSVKLLKCETKCENFKIY